jgi:macrodomain Ter protein organizer (MatP/YcbG family)
MKQGQSEQKNIGKQQKGELMASPKSIRIPETLLKKLLKRAKKEGRTLSNLVIYLLNKVIDKK